MKLVNPITKYVYEVQGPVYENRVMGIWCGNAVDKKYGHCFVKIIDYGSFTNAQQRKEALVRAKAEADCMRLVSQCTTQTPDIYDDWDDRAEKKYVIIMQRMGGKTLRQWMDEHSVEKLLGKDIFLRSRIVLQICTIMRDIQKKYPVIVHRDLKPENIFIQLNKERHWEISIIDFGCANLNYVRNVGTVAYQAPEQTGIKDCPVKISVKTDIFAIGQIYYELLTGHVPAIGTEYRRRATEYQWAAYPELPEKLMQSPGVERLNSLLIQMTAFRAEERPVYDKIISELNHMKFR